MEIKNGKVYLDETIGSFSVAVDGVYYTDSHNDRIFIPMSLIVHFYEAAKFEHERKRKDISWNDFCNSLFESDT